MKLLLALCMLALPANAWKDRAWTPAVVESTFRTTDNGALANTPVQESIYIDAGEWLYHVVQTVHQYGTLHLRDGTRIEIAVEGKHLFLRYDGKETKLTIDQKSRGKKGAVIQ
jgi:hypothetical protein